MADLCAEDQQRIAVEADAITRTCPRCAAQPGSLCPTADLGLCPERLQPAGVDPDLCRRFCAGVQRARVALLAVEAARPRRMAWDPGS